MPPAQVLGVARSPARLAATCLAALLASFGIDAAVFRSGLYPLEPDSTTGLFEMILRREQEAQERTPAGLVVTLGDSRFALSPKLCNAFTPRTGLVFRSAGVAGTDARAWYYMLRDLDPRADRYRAVVFGVSDYDDLGDSFDNANDERTLHYVVGRLRFTDVVDFAMSHTDATLRFRALRGGLFKGFVLARDVRAFLRNPPRRLNYVALCRTGFEGWTYDFEETETTMVGLQIDWATNTATFPPGMSSDQLGTVNAHLEPQHVDERVARFQRLWFGRIAEHYRGSTTRILFLRLARGPIPRPSVDPAVPAPSSIRDLATRPGVALADPHAFDFLEHPELFKDGAHLNREGIARFSPRVVEVVASLLGAPRP